MYSTLRSVSLCSLALAALAACSGSPGVVTGSSGDAARTVLPAASTSSTTQIRFLEGAPQVETLINGAPSGLGTQFLRVNGATIQSNFPYGSITYFNTYGTKISLELLNSLGYSAGPFSISLAAGKSYTVALIGSYPKYRLIAFPEPKDSGAATLAVYEASPSLKSVDFGRYTAKSGTNFKKLGSVSLGNVATVGLGSVKNFGAYVGKGTKPITGGRVTPVSVDGFDTANALPFENASRLSLFVLDPLEGATTGPVIGVLDQ
jgi:hypothetical protein